MGRIREALGKVGDRAFGTPEERREQRDFEKRVRAKEKVIYQKAYYKERLKQAKVRGRKKARAEARKGTGTTRLLNIADNFAEAGKDLAFNDPFAPKKSKKKKKNDWLF